MFLWKVILGYNGVLIHFNLLITEPLTFLLYNANTVVLALTHSWAPFAILPIFVSLEKIDRSLLSNTDLGDSAIDQFLDYAPTIRTWSYWCSSNYFYSTVGDYITPKLIW